MDLYEYQAKHLFGKHHVPVTPGEVCSTGPAAHSAARKIGSAVVVKAQVKVGGRGKAGGVKLADTPDDAQAKAEAILGAAIELLDDPTHPLFGDLRDFLWRPEICAKLPRFCRPVVLRIDDLGQLNEYK